MSTYFLMPAITPELLGLGQSLIYSIQSSGLPMMEITLRRGTAAAHYVLGGPQGNDNNAFSLGTAATEINVMNGKTAAKAYPPPRPPDRPGRRTGAETSRCSRR